MAQNLKINITAKDKTQQAFQGVRGKLKGLKDSIFSVQGALVGLGGGLAIRSIVGTGRSIEDLQVRLKQLFGSTQEGAKAFQVMTDFASQVPFSLEQIQNASGNLAVVSGNAERLSKILEITGNVASVTGLDFQTTAEQIQRAFAGGIASADIFREKGVRDLLGFKAGATVSAEETIKAFEKVFGKGGKFGTATDELANTFTGTLSMLSDSVFKFQKRVADKDFFASLKKEFKDLDGFIKENEATFNDIADAIGGALAGAVKLLSGTIKAIAVSVDAVTTAYEFLIQTLNKLPLVNIKLITKEQRQLQRELMKYEDTIMRIARLRDEELKATIKTSLASKKTTEETQKTFNIFESHHKLVKAVEDSEKRRTDRLIGASRNIFDEQQKIEKSVKGQATLGEEILLKIREQNNQFSLSSEILGTINSFTSRVSRSIAEAVVLGKSLNMSFKELAQQLLVDVLAKMIERIALLTIEKFIVDKIFKQDTDKLRMEKNITKEKQKQVMLQALLMAMGGGSGGGSGGFKLFASGGAVRKGQPTIVGERGAEMFIPNSSGQITQSARGTGGGAVNVNFTINTIDSRGFDQALIENRGTISSIINSALAEKGRGELI